MNERAFIRAVHYFGDQWPINFWSSFTAANVESDFTQIRADGFNCIILLLPMRMFIRSADGIALRYQQRFDTLIAAAAKHNLLVILRVGYPYDFCPTHLDLGPPNRRDLSRLVHEKDEVYQLFLDHLAFVKALTAGSEHIAFVFLSWEDSWGLMKSLPDANEATRTEISLRIGFDRFAKSALQRSLDQVIPIPTRTDPSFALFKRFYERYMRERFLSPLCDHFPNVAYEQRVDAQKIVGADGKARWIEFDGYSSEQAVCFSYWAPFMGTANLGETISAQAAMESLKKVETKIRERSKGQHFIDQFNFIVGTAEVAKTSAQIAPSELRSFLSEALAYLKDTTLGYGLWAYRDYRQSFLVNGTFELGTFNWDIEGEAQLVGDGPFWIRATGPCRLRTTFVTGRALKGFPQPLRLWLTFDSQQTPEQSDGFSITASTLGRSATVRSTPGQRTQTIALEVACSGFVDFGAPLELLVEVPVGKTWLLRNFQLFTHVLSNGLYSVNNESSEAMDVIRDFNRALTDQR